MVLTAEAQALSICAAEFVHFHQAEAAMLTMFNMVINVWFSFCVYMATKYKRMHKNDPFIVTDDIKYQPVQQYTLSGAPISYVK